MLSLKRNCIEDKKHFLIYWSEYNDLNEDFHSFIILRAYPHKFYASTRLNKIEVILESHAYTRKLRRVSLPKSESRLLIRKMDIPFFLVKSKTGLLIQMIHNVRRCILWIVSEMGYFRYTIRRVSLLRIRKGRVCGSFVWMKNNLLLIYRFFS